MKQKFSFTILCSCSIRVHADSIGYVFGSQRPGFITFSFPEIERVDQRYDQLAFGFATNQKDAVIVHVTSGNTNDYLSVELVPDSEIFRKFPDASFKCNIYDYEFF